MTLFNIAAKNIKKNFYNYFLYFVSMVFSIVIYFTFASLQYSKEIEKVTVGGGKIDTVFKGSSVIIAVFVAIFIWYSNSFFTKKRKKEVGLYSMLGVKKSQIGRMLFYENIFMGIIALGIGIVIGSLLSKLFMMFLVKLMGFSIAIKFTIVPKAIIQTAVIFLVIFGVTSIHGYTIIYRFKLIELFNAEKSGDKAPKASKIVAILAVILLGFGYWLAFNAMGKNFGTNILIVLISTVAGTYALFYSLIIYILKLLKKNKNRYYKGSNMIGISQLLYRVKGNASTLATIAVLSATTITAMGTTYSFLYDQKQNVDTQNPFAYVFNIEDPKTEKTTEEIFKAHTENKVTASVSAEFITNKAKFPNIMKNAHISEYESKAYILSESKYNEFLKAEGNIEKVNLAAGNAVYVPSLYIDKDTIDVTGKPLTLVLENKKIQLNIQQERVKRLVNYNTIGDIVVVKDDLYKELYNKDKLFKLKAVEVADKKNIKSLDEDLMKHIEQKPKSEDFYFDTISSYYSNYRGTMEASGLFIFIGGFLGLVFLMCTGSIIFFKQLSEANDDRRRYNILKKIGTNKGEIKSSIAKQMLFIFGLPLVVAISHSLVALSILTKILLGNLMIPISITIGCYSFIYMIYYFLTVSSYYKSIMAKS